MPSAKTLKRLEGLEAVIRAPEPPAKLRSALGVFLIAFRLGGWREDGHEFGCGGVCESRGLRKFDGLATRATRAR